MKFKNKLFSDFTKRANMKVLYFEQLGDVFNEKSALSEIKPAGPDLLRWRPLYIAVMEAYKPQSDGRPSRAPPLQASIIFLVCFY